MHQKICKVRIKTCVQSKNVVHIKICKVCNSCVVVVVADVSVSDLKSRIYDLEVENGKIHAVCWNEINFTIL